MSRVPIRTFVVTAKRHLQETIKNKGTASFVVGNESADLDSITCALVYGYIESSKHEARRANHVTIPVTNIPASDLPLRPELTALLKHADIKPSDLITLDDLGDLPMPLEKADWTLVDHNALTGPLAQHYKDAVTAVIDHHDDESAVPSTASPRVVEKCGSCNSLLINYLRPTWDSISSLSTSVGAANAQDSEGLRDDSAYTNTWDAQVAKFALGSILIDTYNMTDSSKITEHDKKAVRYLEARMNISKYGKDYDRQTFFDEINTAKSDLDGLGLEDILRKDYKQWEENGLQLGIAAVVKPMRYLSAKAAKDEKKHFKDAVVEFAQSRQLDIVGIMTAYTNDSGEFGRQLLLIALKDGKAKEAAERFAERSSQELDLQDADAEVLKGGRGGLPFIRFWQQGNLSASRKRVGPLLREAMR